MPGATRLILASASPRRRELLGRLTDDFVVIPSDVEEGRSADPAVRAVEAARAKASAVGAVERGVILGADTVVAVDGRVLGKPGSREEARGMIAQLAGRRHSVYTGLCVRRTDSGEEWTACEETRVTFRRLEADEIEAYLDTGEYSDKAGGYALQGRAAKFVAGIEGDYTNVIGLPLCRVTLLLREVGVRL